MSIIKRLSATVASHIEKVVGEIEDHDAVIHAALGDMRKKVAEAKVRLGQVRREKDRLEQLGREQKDHAERWRRRAVECAGNDEAKALECVSRARHCEQQAERLDQALCQYEQAADKLTGDIELSEQRLAVIKQKQTLMRARQSTSSALSATSETRNDAIELLDDSFDRWEIKISQDELSLDGFDPVDPIEREFVTQEQEDELRNELASLLAKEDKQ